MAKYPELKGAPSKCLSTSPMTMDALKIRAPYGKTDKAEIEQRAIVDMGWGLTDRVSPWELFDDFWRGKNQNVKKGRPEKLSYGVGWETDAELMVLNKMKALGKSLVNKNAKYEPQARPKIISLTDAALKQLNFISNVYKHWDDIGWAAKVGGFVKLTLRSSNEDIQANLKDDHGQIWPAQRTDAREQIRKAWDKALRFLWCAVYAANQSKAYLKNQELAMQGVVLKASPTQVNIKGVKAIPAVSVKKVTLVPTTEEPEFQPGMPEEPEEEIVEEEEIIEEKPKKKKNTGLLIAGAAAVALLAMKR